MNNNLCHAFTLLHIHSCTVKTEKAAPSYIKVFSPWLDFGTIFLLTAVHNRERESEGKEVGK